MKIWDQVIGAEMDLAQLPMPFYRPQRLVTKHHISGGFMHSFGYSDMVHRFCPEKGMSTEDFISDPAQFCNRPMAVPTGASFTKSDTTCKIKIGCLMAPPK